MNTNFPQKLAGIASSSSKFICGCGVVRWYSDFKSIFFQNLFIFLRKYLLYSAYHQCSRISWRCALKSIFFIYFVEIHFANSYYLILKKNYWNNFRSYPPICLPPHIYSLFKLICWVFYFLNWPFNHLISLCQHFLFIMISVFVLHEPL